MTVETDYSNYTLQQLLNTRYWFDAGHNTSGVRSLEEEIQKRCARFQGKGTAATELGTRYRLYGLMFGVFFFAVSIGPFVTIEFLDLINVIADVNGDNALLSGVWALFTLPFAVMVFMIGGIMDTERIVKWFKL